MLSPYHTLYKIKSNSNGDSTIANNANMCIVITLENGLNDNNIIYHNTFTKGACRTSTNTRASASACASAITFTISRGSPCLSNVSSSSSSSSRSSSSTINTNSRSNSNGSSTRSSSSVINAVKSFNGVRDQKKNDAKY
ncbi:hypothetical protein GQX74_015544 [Glossina fuscipes]|nr:hypothetical protein GQX74_015544 [Glossina fuscipes]